LNSVRDHRRGSKTALSKVGGNKRRTPWHCGSLLDGFMCSGGSMPRVLIRGNLMLMLDS